MTKSQNESVNEIKSNYQSALDITVYDHKCGIVFVSVFMRTHTIRYEIGKRGKITRDED